MSELCNRAYDIKLNLELSRKNVSLEKLLAANSDAELATALGGMHDRMREILLCKPNLLFHALHDKKFPRNNREAQEQFIADSLAALGQVSIRRSRDIVQGARAAEKKKGKIIRREFYIECSCGYEGPAYHDACPDCGANVSYLDFATGF